jgi:enoyl-CoA hydratase/carnithine racemase
MRQHDSDDAPPTSPILHRGRDRATIRLNRPQYRNRIEHGDLDVLREMLTNIEQDPAIRVLVLTGTGATFCSGYDLGALKSGASAPAGPDLFESLVDQLEELRIPTICALNGSVYGGATDLALACDFRIGIEGMQLLMPASRLGIHYYRSGLMRYVTRLGLGPAKLLFLTAEPIDSEKLQQIGYLDEVVPSDRLNQRVDALATTLSGRAPLAVQGMKRALNRIARGNADADEIDAAVARSLRSEDLAEGLAAWTEKRPPVFRGK